MPATATEAERRTAALTVSPGNPCTVSTMSAGVAWAMVIVGVGVGTGVEVGTGVTGSPATTTTPLTAVALGMRTPGGRLMTSPLAVRG